MSRELHLNINVNNSGRHPLRGVWPMTLWGF